MKKQLNKKEYARMRFLENTEQTDTSEYLNLAIYQFEACVSQMIIPLIGLIVCASVLTAIAFFCI